jgi:hypothetical protein
MLGTRATPVAGCAVFWKEQWSRQRTERWGDSGPVPVYRNVCKPWVLCLRSQSEAVGVGMSTEGGAATGEREIRFWLLHIWWLGQTLMEAARRIQFDSGSWSGDGTS